MAPTDVLACIGIGLAALTVSAAIILGWIAWVYRARIIEAELKRLGIKTIPPTR